MVTTSFGGQAALRTIVRLGPVALRHRISPALPLSFEVPTIPKCFHFGKTGKKNFPLYLLKGKLKKSQ